MGLLPVAMLAQGTLYAGSVLVLVPRAAHAPSMHANACQSWASMIACSRVRRPNLTLQIGLLAFLVACCAVLLVLTPTTTRQEWKAKGLEVHGIAVDVSTTEGRQALFNSVRLFRSLLVWNNYHVIPWTDF